MPTHDGFTDAGILTESADILMSRWKKTKKDCPEEIKMIAAA
jgi:hypothetical protein